MITIKTNKELFDRINEIGESVKFLRGIVQNNMELESYQVTEFIYQKDKMIEELNQWVIDVMATIEYK